MKLITSQLYPGDPIPLIILTRDVKSEMTQKCLRNLRACTRLPLKLYIVEDSGPGFRYGRFMNYAIRASAPSKFIMGMDDDSFPKPGCFEKLIAYYQRDDRLGCVGVTTEAPGIQPNVGAYNQSIPSYLSSYIMAKAPFNGLHKLFFGNCGAVRLALTERHRPGKMLVFSTSFFILRRQCFEDVGGFDERFVHEGVDTDFLLRVLLSEKWFVSTCPEAVNYHEWRMTKKGADPKGSDFKWFTEKWNRQRMRAVARAAREGKFICKVV